VSAIFEQKKIQPPSIQPLKEGIPPSTQKKKVLILAGPTGVGKTHFSLKIAQAIGGEIVSADSVQIYRGMDIGTAKVTQEERATIPHHLIDIREITDAFNVVDYTKAAEEAMKGIFIRGHVPIVVGGTGFYIHSLIYGPPTGPPSDEKLRHKLEHEMEEQGPEALHKRLCELDPLYAKTITQRDRNKIIRALEIITLTHQKVSDFAAATSTPSEQYQFHCWFLYQKKEALYPRLEMRCDKMIASGFVDEVKALEARGLRQNSSASAAIGYRQCLDYLLSSQTQEEWDLFIAAFKQAAKRYAKRQFTWFRKEPLFRWLDIEPLSEDMVIETILHDFEKTP
jgi:tRNA dimethylallyltransferase